jgi:hypothetical protein
MSEQLKANFKESARFVLHKALIEHEVKSAKAMQALLASPGGRQLLQSMRGTGGPLKASEAGDSSLPPSMTADPAGAKGTGPLDSADPEELQRETLGKTLAPTAAWMRTKTPAPYPAAAERPRGSGGIYLFWFVMVFSAAAIVASFAIK